MGNNRAHRHTAEQMVTQQQNCDHTSEQSADKNSPYDHQREIDQLQMEINAHQEGELAWADSACANLAKQRRDMEHVGSEYPAIQRVKEYLAAYYAEDVSLETLAGVANLSAFHFARVFRQVVGLPPHAYHIQLRLWQARKLLVQGFPASYVAQETGFFDQTHLTHMFKRHFGVTPGTYRKTARFY